MGDEQQRLETCHRSLRVQWARPGTAATPLGHRHNAWGQGAAVPALLSEDWGLRVLRLDFTA